MHRTEHIEGRMPLMAGRSWLLFVLLLPMAMAQGAESFMTQQHEDRLEISLGRTPVATYVWQDPDIPRPHFRQVKTLNGIQVTRNYPSDPELDQGNSDHATFHPGIWMAFGDINGVDFWRNRGRVRHLEFVEAPVAENRYLRFTVLNRYETQDTPPVAIGEERCTYTFFSARKGVILVAQSEFLATEGPLTFGDQEEMGLGVRLATPLRVDSGQGGLINSLFARNEAGTWGKAAEWCAGDGRVNDRRAGILLMTGPDNFRESWFHSRDYGLIVANPFGEKSMTGPDNPAIALDSTVVPAGESLSLSFGVYIYDTHWTKGVQYREMHAEFLNLLKSLPDTPAGSGGN